MSEVAIATGSIEIRSDYWMKTNVWHAHCVKCKWQSDYEISKDRAILAGFKNTDQLNDCDEPAKPAKSPAKKVAK